jgi:hypothetical protein
MTNVWMRETLDYVNGKGPEDFEEMVYIALDECEKHGYATSFVNHFPVRDIPSIFDKNNTDLGAKRGVDYTYIHTLSKNDKVMYRLISTAKWIPETQNWLGYLSFRQLESDVSWVPCNIGKEPSPLFYFQPKD